MNETRLSETLEQVLADERGQAQVLRHNGHAHDADLIERVCQRVAESAEDYLRFVSEGDAMLASGKGQSFLRQRYPEWESLGHAKKVGAVRYYRLVILPRRANVAAAFEEGRQIGLRRSA